MKLYLVKYISLEEPDGAARYVVADDLSAASRALGEPDREIVSVQLVTDVLVFAVDKRH